MMEDILGGTGGTGAADATVQMDFSMVFSLIWKIVLAILNQAGVFEELAQFGIDLSQYINASNP